MTITAKHVFVSGKANTSDLTAVQGARDWDDGHAFTGGSNGNVLARDTSDATYGASWTATMVSSAIGLLLTGAGGSIAGFGQSTPLVVQSTAAGIDFANTAFLTTDVHYRWQLHNSNSSNLFEFNYFSGGGTSVQTGWTMDPTNAIFTSNGGVTTPNHTIQRAGGDIGYHGSRALLEGGTSDDVIVFAKGNLYLGGGNTWPARAVLITGSALTVTGAFACNGTTAQTAVVSGGALAAYGAGANGFDTAGHASALYALVVAMRGALVANGIMS